MSSEDKKHRSHLPMPNTVRPTLITYDAKDPDTKFPPIEQLRPPEGAPNVLVILIDDAGFGSASAFGGPCQTPAAEQLAAAGLKYTRFHTTALCSPTRQALLTGRNHHSAGMGGITEIATGAPGYCSVLPNSMSPLAQTLKLNGYSTAQFGKCHEVPVWETSPAGPFDAWPTGGGGFEYFYGFIGGEANQWYPTLYEGTTPVEPKKTPEEGYHFVDDMTEKAMNWISQQKALAPDKPFFVYFAPGATHAPHHVPKEWADKYKGKFDQGWDKLREETIARQKELGVIPADCQLTARHKEIPAWDEMPEAFKPLLRHEMEVYAGFLEYTDHHVGRMLDGLKKLGIFDDTLVYYIIGDNGASAEGGINGCFNEMSYFNGLQALETPEYLSARLDKLGGPESYNHYAVGWAHAMNTPYQWTKQVASHWGGTRNGTIVSWPKGIKAKGEIRSQFHHVIDVAPTILEAAGLPGAGLGERRAAGPDRGRQHAVFASTTPRRRSGTTTQYFEMFGNRGIYHKGWTAVTKHRTPWAPMTTQPPASTTTSGSSTTRRGTGARPTTSPRQMPEKLHDLQRLWLIEATRYKVLPLDDRLMEKMNPGYRRPAGIDQGQDPDPLRRHGTPVGELRPQHQEQVALRHRRDRGAGERRRGRDHLPGGEYRRLEPLCKERQAQVLLQLGRLQALHGRVHGADPGGRAPGAHGVRLRRRRSGQGRQGDALHRWQEGRRGRHRRDAGDRLLRRRRLRRGRGQRRAGLPGLRPAGKRFQRSRQRRAALNRRRPENSDHLVKPEDAIRIAMARQ